MKYDWLIEDEEKICVTRMLRSLEDRDFEIVDIHWYQKEAGRGYFSRRAIITARKQKNI